MDMLFQGMSMSLFQAKQQWSRMSSYDWKTRFESQLSRMNCQMFSTGLSSGDFGGNGKSVMLSGMGGFFEACGGIEMKAFDTGCLARHCDSNNTTIRHTRLGSANLQRLSPSPCSGWREFPFRPCAQNRPP